MNAVQNSIGMSTICEARGLCPCLASWCNEPDCITHDSDQQVRVSFGTTAV